MSPERWKDVWLNESFATWAAWYYTEVNGGRTVHDAARATYAARPFPDREGRPFWSVLTADPQRDTMFNDRVYNGGGMMLQFLREKIGDDEFFTLLRTWYAQHKYRNGNTAQFTSLAQRISGQDLSGFFMALLPHQARDPAGLTPPEDGPGGPRRGRSVPKYLVGTRRNL